MIKFLKKHKSISILFMLLIIYLMNANDLIINLDKKNDKLSEISFEQLTAQDQVNFALDEPVLMDDMLKTMYISGWAFCENDLVRPEREISIVLASDKHCYLVSNKATLRRDFYVTFTEQIDNVMSGIETKFSTINIQNGIYRLYIYVSENETRTGLAYTGMQFEKKHGNLKRIENN